MKLKDRKEFLNKKILYLAQLYSSTELNEKEN